MLVMLPLLTICADFFGIIGGYLIGVGKLGIAHGMYVKMTFDPLALKDVITGVIKSLSFATIICVIACFEGINSATSGAEGVGKATTSSVVRSFILIIIADCFWTALFYFILAK